MSRAARIVTMWTDDQKVHVSLRGDADADVAVRLETVLARLLRSGANHVVVHLDRLNGDDTAVVEALANTCHLLWLQQGIMETSGMRGGHHTVPQPRESSEVIE